MARKSKTTNLTEILSKEINPTGDGEHPIIQKILDPQTAYAPPAEIYELMSAFQNQILQVTSALNNMSDKVSNLIDRVNAFDEASRRWDEDRKKFLEEVQAKAESLKITSPDEMERFQAQRAKELQDIYQDVRTKILLENKQREEQLDREPKVVVRGVGSVEMVTRNGIVVQELVPDAIQIGRRIYVFPPNQDVEVPQSIAQEYQSILEQRRILEQRKKLLDGNNPPEFNEVVSRWNELNKDMKDGGEQMTPYEG